ncbi:NAD(P)-dependent dehydrogenase (short-subunit alcohol dehydrogenase family) [Novosphingobium hassiacum]|uniref:NAD(P)-dependent dehydrogenase (Short-subunit alcohol dehydrogenase family) n=1 Tax=Novosphingobium hassiacum TaxID=173676 RepID=A0A7W5ZY41_9SPHN|nr:glucose 1-dehydrogenase [Novosphingobium hassiacum]MBB3862150.1 NAD(P)-dependent dehydrogenase (short-subunit alcohol dehydrogenase family) [Novosphingobium hassiacum]
MARLTGKVALVTGGAKGIGNAIARRFVEEGARVALAARTIEQASAAAQALGEGVLPLALDTTSDAQWRAAIDAIDQEWGGLNVLVNCAGVTIGASLVDTDDANWNQHMDVNLRGPFMGCRAAIGLMGRDGAPGSIVNISSAFGVRVTPGFAAYSISKAALNALTRVLALECAAQKLPIRVNTVIPGGIETEMFEEELRRTGMERDKAYALFSRIHPMGRIGKPEEVAEAATWLASDASSFTTGVELAVDGGSTIRT